MQGPGGPEEDTSDGFTSGGWTVPLFDESLGLIMAEQMSKPFDLLLGRKTYELFASYWPQHIEEGPGINQATKYVASHAPREYTWERTVLLQSECADAHSFPLLEESNITEAKVIKALPYLAGKPKGDRSMER